MPGLLPDVDPDGLLEYSVVFTDRSLNHMSKTFQGVMNDVSTTLKQVYGADAVVVVPGSGTFAMEAVARQFATGRRCLVVRNGLFSFRWSQIFDAGGIPAEVEVLQARPADDADTPVYRPAPVDEVIEAVAKTKAEVVFAPHVETSSGMILPDDYIRELGAAVRGAGGLFVLDCIASGAIWADMRDLGVDVLISAPQKGWSGSPCCGLVMLSSRAKEVAKSGSSTSFACDLGKWLEIMAAYEGGAHAYHATMPTDGIRRFRDVMKETEVFGFDRARGAQQELGTRVRELLAGKGFKSVAAKDYEAPGVVVSYAPGPPLETVKKFAAAGIQIAAGVPLKCGESEDFRTFRIGLFGLDKLQNVDRTVTTLSSALDGVV